MKNKYMLSVFFLKKHMSLCIFFTTPPKPDRIIRRVLTTEGYNICLYLNFLLELSRPIDGGTFVTHSLVIKSASLLLQ